MARSIASVSNDVINQSINSLTNEARERSILPPKMNEWIRISKRLLHKSKLIKKNSRARRDREFRRNFPGVPVPIPSRSNFHIPVPIPAANLSHFLFFRDPNQLRRRKWSDNCWMFLWRRPAEGLVAHNPSKKIALEFCWTGINPGFTFTYY
jgi:hypothetical protein